MTRRSSEPRGRRRRGRRSHPYRTGNPRVLILCEGTKTEVFYFRALKTDRHLTSIVVRPARVGQSGPRGLWERARDELRKDPGWDAIYCVLDHDGRDTEIDNLQRRLTALGERRGAPRIEMILSDPCFEYWLLLHFEFTDRPFIAAGKGRTACDEVIQRLGRHLPDYEKNDPGIFERCGGRVDAALHNAARAGSSRESGTPRTDVGELVARLLEIAARRGT